MHKFKMIYLDMDGVIANFDKRFIELFGVNAKNNLSEDEFQVYFKKFLDGKNFTTLDLMPGANILFGYLNNTGLPIHILSSTSSQKNHDEVSYQKEIWLNKHHIDYPAIFVPGKEYKPNFADSESILIDDTESIIKGWNKAGGVGILHTDALTTIDILVTMLRV
jgi:hypothetical protein